MNEALQISTIINGAMETIKTRTDVKDPYRYWLSLCAQMYKEKHGWPTAVATKQFELAYQLLNIQSIVSRGSLAPDVGTRPTDPLHTKRVTGPQQGKNTTLTRDERIAAWQKILNPQSLDLDAKLVGYKEACTYLKRCLENDELSPQDLHMPWLEEKMTAYNIT